MSKRFRSSVRGQLVRLRVRRLLAIDPTGSAAAHRRREVRKVVKIAWSYRKDRVVRVLRYGRKFELNRVPSTVAITRRTPHRGSLRYRRVTPVPGRRPPP